MKCFVVALWSFLLLSGSVGSERVSGISATGGGVVEEGKEMVLKYDVGGQWDMCYWYRFDTPTAYEYCLFVAQPNTPTAKKRRCKPADSAADSIMTYSGETNTECTITVSNVDLDDNRTWAVRVDEQMNKVPIDITVAQKVKSIGMEVAAIEAGKPGKVKCKVVGGRPAPEITYGFEDPREGLDTGSIGGQVPDKDGIYTSEMEISLKPEIEDDGRVVTCSAQILDGEEKPMFAKVTSKAEKLNVVYPPQKAENQTKDGKAGDDVSFEFVVAANPKPEATWTVMVAKKVPGKEGGNDTTDDKPKFTYDAVNVVPGKDTDKYSATELVAVEGEGKKNTYKASFVVKKVDGTDHNSKFQLVAKNSVGEQTYHFEVAVEGMKPPKPNASGEGLSALECVGIAVGVIALIVILGVVGLILVKKGNRNRSETAPLNQ